jgi:hypothetical protein
MIRRLGRLPAVAAAAAVLAAAGALASLAPGSPLVSSCAGAGSGHAALVVEHGDGSVLTRCVAFGTATVTGEQLLNKSGVAWSGQTFGSYGAAVCAMDAEPAHYTTCPGQDYYWAVFVSRGRGAWQLSSIGISSLTLGDGDAEGFRYVRSVGTPAVPVSPAGVCAAGAPTAVPATAAGPTALAHATAATGGGGATPGPVASDSPGAAAATATTGNSGDAPAGSAAPSAGDSGLAIAGASAATSADPGAVSRAPGPAPSSGLDPGLFIAALAGGGLAGLALLRLAATRRRV